MWEGLFPALVSECCWSLFAVFRSSQALLTRAWESQPHSPQYGTSANCGPKEEPRHTASQRAKVHFNSNTQTSNNRGDEDLCQWPPRQWPAEIKQDWGLRRLSFPRSHLLSNFLLTSLPFLLYSSSKTSLNLPTWGGNSDCTEGSNRSNYFFNWSMLYIYLWSFNSECSQEAL